MEEKGRKIDRRRLDFIAKQVIDYRRTQKKEKPKPEKPKRQPDLFEEEKKNEDENT